MVEDDCTAMESDYVTVEGDNPSVREEREEETLWMPSKPLTVQIEEEIERFRRRMVLMVSKEIERLLTDYENIIVQNTHTKNAIPDNSTFTYILHYARDHKMSVVIFSIYGGISLNDKKTIVESSVKNTCKSYGVPYLCTIPTVRNPCTTVYDIGYCSHVHKEVAKLDLRNYVCVFYNTDVLSIQYPEKIKAITKRSAGVFFMGMTPEYVSTRFLDKTSKNYVDSNSFVTMVV